MTLMCDNGWNNGGGSGVWMLMVLFMIVFWTLVVGGVVWLLRNKGHQHQEPTAPGESAARRILDERFARGELTEEEYRQRRELLEAR